MTRIVEALSRIVVAFSLAALPGACVPQTDAADALPPGTWRGDVSYPGLPAIGVLFDLNERAPRMIAAPNMGFGGSPLEDFDDRGDSISFRWSLNGDPYDCVIRRQPDGTLLGPCTSPDEPTIGVRMVPPGVDAPTGHARTLLEMSSVRWVPVEDVEATMVWVAAENRPRLLQDSVAEEVQRARLDNAALFGDVARTLPLDVFLVGDRQVMAALVGRPVGGWTDPMAGAVALAGLGENSVALRHEMTHAISFNAWGPPHQGAPWLAEGLATWVAGECAGNALHDLARDMRERGELVPLSALLDRFQQQDDIVAYLQSGSIVGYIIETHGVEAFRRVWLGGADALRSIDTDVATLEADWLRALDARAAVEVDRDAIRAGGCG